MLKQAFNKVIVEGILSENKLEIKTTNDGRVYIAGEMVIEVDKENVIPVSAFSFEKKKDGTDNVVFKSLKTVMDTFKSIATAGRENADKVRVTTGEVSVNEFYTPDGRLVSYPRIRSSFFNKVVSDFAPKAEFQVEVFIASKKPEIVNEEESGRLVLKGIIPIYGGKVEMVDFVVADKKGIDFIDGNYETGHTAKIAGKIINAVKKTVKIEDTGFGDPIETVTTTVTREMLVTKGTLPYDEGYDKNEIKKALSDRETALQELKEKAKKTSGSGAGSEDFDF